MYAAKAAEYDGLAIHALVIFVTIFPPGLGKKGLFLEGQAECETEKISGVSMDRIVAAAAPAYLPDWNWFAKMARVDCFVLADDLPFSKSGTVHRTRIKTVQGVRWLTVPVATRGTGPRLIRDVPIDLTRHWSRKHWRSLQVNYRYAPYFDYYADAFAEIYHREWRFLLDLNLTMLAVLQDAFRLHVPQMMSSSLPAQPGVSASERIVQVVQACGGRVYLAAAADRAFLNADAFAAAGIRLAFLEDPPRPYRQLFGEFIPNLSVIDLLFNQGVAAAGFL